MRIADPSPPYCSKCFGAAIAKDPRPTFVDFQAAYDGPVITRSGEEVRPENYQPINVDWLVLCEDCLKAAGNLIGLAPAEDIREEMNELQAFVKEVQEDNKAKDKMISHLERTIEELIEHPIKRPSGRPQIKGPASKDAELKKVRSARNMREKASKAKKKQEVAA